MSVIGFHIQLNFRVFQHLVELSKRSAYDRGDYAHIKYAVRLLTCSIEKEYEEWQKQKEGQNLQGEKS